MIIIILQFQKLQILRSKRHPITLFCNPLDVSELLYVFWNSITYFQENLKELKEISVHQRETVFINFQTVYESLGYTGISNYVIKPWDMFEPVFILKAHFLRNLQPRVHRSHYSLGILWVCSPSQPSSSTINFIFHTHIPLSKGPALSSIYLSDMDTLRVMTPTNYKQINNK